MLKFIFWSLVAINGALFAYGKGYLGHFSGSEREPARLAQQLHAEQLRIIPAEKANAAAAAAARTAEAAAKNAAAAVKAETLACVEIGNFVLADARRFENKLDALELGDRQSRHNLPGSEISSYIVYIPPQGSKEGADKKAGELKALGVTNFFIMPDTAALKWAISLGVFKTEAAANNQLAALMKQGVRSARVAPRMSGSKLLAFQFRDVEPELKSKLEHLRSSFAHTDMRSCK